MDKNNLVILFLGKLNKQCSSSVHETPTAASRKNKELTESSKKQKGDPLQLQLVDHIAVLQKLVALVALLGIQGQIINYRKDIFSLQ